MAQSIYLNAAKENKTILHAADSAENACRSIFSAIEDRAEENQLKVLEAFRALRVSPAHFMPSYGYGYYDLGRDKLGELFARVMGTEDALVRPGIASGTHALACALFGLLAPGDELLFASGQPYDTLFSIIGNKGEPGTLQGYGIRYSQLPLKQGSVDYTALAAALQTKPRVCMLQRSRGYCNRPSLCMGDFHKLIPFIKSHSPHTVVLVDNCYGEFVELSEPAAAGADVVAGSLIKNPGGGLAPTGGYIAGSSVLLNRIAARMTSPGIGREVGSYAAGYLPFFQGLYLAPQMVKESMKGAVFTAALLQALGFSVSPGPKEPRGCIIQTVQMENKEQLIAFCQAIQSWSPVDAYVTPEPWAMPGYADPVIMAAGAFIQGASLELSADAPLRAPYTVYMQGGLCYPQVKAAAMAAAAAVLEN